MDDDSTDRRAQAWPALWAKIKLWSVFTLFLLFCFFAMLALATFAAAGLPAQQYNKIFAQPFYRPSMSLNTNYSYTIQVNPSDGISNVLSAIISMDVYQSPTVTYSIWINGVACATPAFTVSTSFAGAGQGRITFDCSNVITMPGVYNVNLRVTQANTGASSLWLDLTYMNNPLGDVTIHGTEYTLNQQSKIWLQLLNSSSLPITTAVCYVDIYTPNNAIMIERATMTNFNHDGIYYYDFNVPLHEGVYPVIATCYYNAVQTSNFPDRIVVRNGTLDTGNIQDVAVEDASYMATTETASGLGNPRRYLSEVYFNQSMCNISSALLTGITVHWVGRWNSNIANDDMALSIFNYTSNRWETFPNTIIGSGTGVKQISNSFSFNNMSQAGLLNSSGQGVRLQFNDTSLADGSSTGFDYDYLVIHCDQLGSPQWQQVKGSSEIHVTNQGLNYLIDVGEYANVPSVEFNNFMQDYYTSIFIHNFTVENIADEMLVNESITYMPFHSLPCNAITQFYRIESNGSFTPMNYTTQWHTQENHCSINFKQTMDIDTNYNYEVTARNSWESFLRSVNTGVGSAYPLISAGCDYWALARNETPYPYIIPKNQTNVNRTYFYRACNNFYDDFYWFNNTYNTELADKALIVDEAGFLQYESDYYSSEFASIKLGEIFHILINGLIATGIYSQVLMANPLNRTNTADNQFWANISSPQIGIYLISKAPAEVWDYPNRTLTSGQEITVNFNGTVQVNVTQNSTVVNTTTIENGIIGLQGENDMIGIILVAALMMIIGLVILLASGNTGMVFLAVSMFAAALVLFFSQAVDIAAYINLGLMLASVFKILRLRKSSSKYVG